MKKHSPNFIENLQEADTSTNNRATTFFWTVLLITTLMLGFSLTSCNITSSDQDKEALQKQFNYIYPLSSIRYIVFDSAHVYDIRVDLQGNIDSKVKIK